MNICNHKPRNIFFISLFLSSAVAIAYEFLYVPEDYAGADCEGCNQAAISRAGYRVPGVLKVNETYTFVFRDGSTQDFFYRTPFLTTGFEARGAVGTCTYSCHQHYEEQKNK